VHPGGVSSEYDRQPLCLDADSAKRPQVMMIERRGPHSDQSPSMGDGRLGLVTTAHSVQWARCISAGCTDREHGGFSVLPQAKRSPKEARPDCRDDHEIVTA